MKKSKKRQKNRLRQIISVLVKHNIFLGLNPVKFREILEDLGTTYIKIGQILSLRDDLLGEEYTKELAKLQSNVPEMTFNEIEKIFLLDYGKNIDEIFMFFDPTPLGSASIAQVHRAVLKSNKKEVVVKIQRPHLFETLKNDVILLKKAISVLKIASNSTATSLEVIVNEMWMILLEEIDFRIELSHIEKFRTLNQDIKYIDFPIPYKEFSNEKILVMEYVQGLKLNDKDKLIDCGYDLKEIGTKLCENYCKQIIEDGFFHADPHFGNLVIRDGKICFLDMGMVGQLSKADLVKIKKCVTAILESDINELKEVLLDLCRSDDNNYNDLINHPKLYSDLDTFVDKYADMSMKDMKMNDLFFDLLAITKEHDLTLPTGFSMLGRGIITIQGVITFLDPNINLIDVLSNHIKENFFGVDNINEEIKQIGKAFYASSKKMFNIPSQVSDFFKMTNKGYTKVNVEVSPEKNLVKTLDKITDKIIISVITAASILGSSILCTTNMNPKLLGIPLIGVIGFILSFVFGIILLFKVINIRLSVFKHKKKK